MPEVQKRNYKRAFLAVIGAVVIGAVGSGIMGYCTSRFKPSRNKTDRLFPISASGKPDNNPLNGAREECFLTRLIESKVEWSRRARSALALGARGTEPGAVATGS